MPLAPGCKDPEVLVAGGNNSTWRISCTMLVSILLIHRVGPEGFPDQSCQLLAQGSTRQLFPRSRRKSSQGSAECSTWSSNRLLSCIGISSQISTEGYRSEKSRFSKDSVELKPSTRAIFVVNEYWHACVQNLDPRIWQALISIRISEHPAIKNFSNIACP